MPSIREQVAIAAGVLEKLWAPLLGSKYTTLMWFIDKKP